MKKICFLIGLLLMAFLSSCCNGQKLDPRDYTKPKPGSIVMDLSANLAGQGDYIWSSNSLIGVFCQEIGASNKRFGVAAMSAGEANGLFNTDLKWEKEIEHNIYVYSPYNENNSSTTISATLPPSQSQYSESNAHLQTNDILYGAVRSVKIDEPVSLTLSSALAFMECRITSASLWRGWSVKSVTISNDKQIAMAGAYTLDLTDGKISPAASTGSNSAGVRISNARAIGDGVFYAFIAALPAALKGIECNVELTVEKANESDKALSGKYTFASDLIRSTTTYLDLGIDNYQVAGVISNTIDLSVTKGTSNSYIASLPGQEYCFPATIMGNGATTPATAGYSVTTAIAPGIIPTTLAPMSAKLLWQTSPGLISNVTLKNGSVFFTTNSSTPLTEGNAVIAVYSGANYTGDILWSWHIWVTSANIEGNAQNYKMYTTYENDPTIPKVVMMDRNLGASKTGLWATAMNDGQGLKYAWGRKDPFPGPNNTAINGLNYIDTYDALGNVVPNYMAGGNQTAATSASFSADIAWRPVSIQATVADAIKYPMNFVQNAQSWNADKIDDLWGDPYSANPAQTGSKSIYDPCPPGWRVPHRYAFTGFTTTGANATDKTTWNVVNATTVVIGTQGGYECYYDGTNSVAYPSTGFINNTSNANLQRVAGAGTSTVYNWLSSPTNATAFEGQTSMFDSGNIYVTRGFRRSYGTSVRCMKE